MDAFKGRGQTTKGIWLARSTKISSPPTLVMDLEGSDGRERGEDDTSFERQSSLFALAIADVLVINIWAKDIGRETGSGKPLLKTVFQVSLGVDQHSGLMHAGMSPCISRIMHSIETHPVTWSLCALQCSGSLCCNGSACRARPAALWSCPGSTGEHHTSSVCRAEECLREECLLISKCISLVDKQEVARLHFNCVTCCYMNAQHNCKGTNHKW